MSPLVALEAGRATVNGIQMYYEIHGRRDGVPLVLLYGGGSTIDVTFGHILPIFAQRCQVIALEEQGHGRTTDRDARSYGTSPPATESGNGQPGPRAPRTVPR